ncbi:MAG: serine/threonine-protein kinase [Aquabacterium sp.]
MALSELEATLAPAQPLPTPQGDEVLYKNERTLVMRRRQPDGRCVIVKQAFGADAQARLRHEASILARLSKVPGVVRQASELADGALVFEDGGGTSLSQQLSRERPSLDRAIELGIALAETVSAIHRAGIIHKDINPSNILLAGPDQRPLLIDFNIATCFAQERLAFTHQHHIIGTLAYMPPEQTGRTGRAIDQRSDLYSLGVTLYEMAAGRKPFESEDLLEMIHDHLAREPVAPMVLDAAIPAPLSEMIMRLLEKEADRRYQSAEGLARDLIRLRDRRQRGDDSAFPLGLDDFPMRLTPPSTLIGRKDEMRALQEAMDRTGREKAAPC